MVSWEVWEAAGARGSGNEASLLSVLFPCLCLEEGWTPPSPHRRHRLRRLCPLSCPVCCGTSCRSTWGRWSETWTPMSWWWWMRRWRRKRRWCSGGMLRGREGCKWGSRAQASGGREEGTRVALFSLLPPSQCHALHPSVPEAKCSHRAALLALWASWAFVSSRRMRGEGERGVAVEVWAVEGPGSLEAVWAWPEV